MVYVPGKLPLVTTDDGNAIVMYLEDELKSISSSVIDDLRAIDLRPESNSAHVLRPRQGMIVYADGVNWNPGYGENAYVRNSAGLWIPLGIPFETLYSARTWFVDNALGSDTNDGLAAGSGRAFKTIQRAINATYALFLNGFNVTISVADATYAAGGVMTRPWFGVGTVSITGNTGTPANCLISTTNLTCFSVSNGAEVNIGGFRFTTSGFPGNAIESINDGKVHLTGKCDFVGVSGSGACLSVRNFGLISIDSGAFNLSGVLGFCLFDALTNGKIQAIVPVTWTWLANTSTPGGYLVRAAGAGTSIDLPSQTFTVAPFANTGKRYDVSALGFINTNGGGINYFPGTIPGTGTDTSVAPWGLYQ